MKFRHAGQDERVVRVWGPERIETGWWRTRLVRRDYYQVETERGRAIGCSASSPAARGSYTESLLEEG